MLENEKGELKKGKENSPSLFPTSFTGNCGTPRPAFLTILDGKKAKKLDLLVKSYNMFQSDRIKAQQRLYALEKEEGDDEVKEFAKEYLETIITPLKKSEEIIAKRIKELLKGEPVYEEFLKKVKGIGPVISGKLLSFNLKLGVPLSSWNAFFGLTPYYFKCECKDGHKFLAPKEPMFCSICERKYGEKTPVVKSEKVLEAPRKIRGYYAFWNPEARSLYWIITDSFIKKKKISFYGQFYEFKKKEIEERERNLPYWRIVYKARRSTFKLFLSHLYAVAHELKGLDYRLPYVFEYLNHDDFVSWKEVLEYEEKLAKDV